MASIQTSIELNDTFTNILNNVINSVNLAVSAMENMQGTMNAEINTSSIEGARAEIDNATMAVNALEQALSQMADVPAPANLASADPAVWQTESLDVFTNSGVERFQQEVQSANAMLQQLSSTQDAIARQAYNTNIFPPEAARDMNSMAVRIDNIRDRIQQIESNPLNMGTDIANAEIERLRGLLNQAVMEQNELNAAVDAMDVSAANEAYQRLNQIVAGTERYLRDEVNEQGRFNREIEHGVSSAGDLRSMIAGAVGAFAGVAGIRKAVDWIKDCTEAFDTQRNAELQLMTVLANTLDADYVSNFAVETEVTADTSDAVAEINDIPNQVDDVTVTASANTQALTSAFDTITAKASEIQSKGIYGDEIMIAGAAELSTYFSDTDAVQMMMDTLTNYAMGMENGVSEVDASTMVNYATGLGKIMSGSYDAMTKKGFEFTDVQKAIIEGEATREQIASALGEEYLDMSHDMQAAAAISQVIDESWSGLYESMSSTPEGKIIQMTNAWGDMKEVIGGQLYPYVILFVDAITENWGTIQTVVDGITFGLQVVLGILSWLLEGAFNFAQTIIDNWGQIGPVIGTVAGAVAILVAAFLAYKVAMGVAAIAQALFNTTLLGCPLVWILVIIMAVIVAVYKIVEAVNKATGSTYSALGVITGALAVAGAFLWNLVLGAVDLVFGVIEYLVNPFISFANFIANLFNDPIGSVIRLFGDRADTVLGLLQKIASAMDFVLGSSMADTVQGWRDDLSGRINEAAEKYGNGKYEEVMSHLDLSAEGMGLSRISYSDAWGAGYSFGEGIDESIAKFDPSSLFGTSDLPSADDYAAALTAGGIGSGIEEIAGDTGDIADSMDITEEELKYLRDIAEQEAVNRFTIAEITIEQTNNNNISSGMDLDGVVSGLTDAMYEAIDTTTEGVHV